MDVSPILTLGPKSTLQICTLVKISLLFGVDHSPKFPNHRPAPTMAAMVRRMTRSMAQTLNLLLVTASSSHTATVARIIRVGAVSYERAVITKV